MPRRYKLRLVNRGWNVSMLVRSFRLPLLLCGCIVAVLALHGCKRVHDDAAAVAPPAASTPGGGGVVLRHTLRASSDRPALTELGRQLFFEKALSASGRMSCASCHDPAHAYGPPNARHDQLPKAVSDIAWAAQLRLHSKFKRLLARRVMKNKAVVAVARELTGFVWAIAREVQTSGWQGIKTEPVAA
jgi:hypothetical protein